MTMAGCLDDSEVERIIQAMRCGRSVTEYKTFVDSERERDVAIQRLFQGFSLATTQRAADDTTMDALSLGRISINEQRIGLEGRSEVEDQIMSILVQVLQRAGRINN